jgi:hypothetical protein
MPVEFKDKNDILQIASKLIKKTHVVLYYSTEFKPNKRARVSGTPFEDVFGIPTTKVNKYSIMEVFIGFDYGEELKSRGMQSADENIGQDTIPKEKWYVDESLNGVVKKHKLTGELYLWVMMSDKPKLEKYFDAISNKELDRIKLADFLPKEPAPKKLDIRTIKLVNIKKIIMD